MATDAILRLYTTLAIALLLIPSMLAHLLAQTMMQQLSVYSKQCVMPYKLTSGYLDLVQRLEFGVDHLQKNAVYQIE